MATEMVEVQILKNDKNITCFYSKHNCIIFIDNYGFRRVVWVGR